MTTLQYLDASGNATFVSPTKPLPVYLETSAGATATYTEDAAAPADPSGSPLMLVREDARAGSLTTTDGDLVALRGNNKGEAYVKTTDSDVLYGGVTETAPATDTASSGHNGRLQRLAQRLTTLMALPKLATPATGTSSAVASGTGAVTILATNAARIGASVANDDANALYLLLGAGTVSATVYTAKLYTDDVYEVPYGFTGILTGLWAADGSGSARVTEYTA